ncbi:hypothetical protein EOL73_00995 [Candidatus Saccharibacteria bacterium]|nr:hypothetical protein [Candidatus Saccharibacteria bacterium]NCU40321.1 hypothetical protein [Candidatus Saccharibacteria bacterium]
MNEQPKPDTQPQTPGIETKKLTNRVGAIARRLGLLMGRGPFSRPRSLEHEVDPNIEMITELQRYVVETEGTVAGAAYTSLFELATKHPGSVKFGTEIDPDGKTKPRRFILAQLATVGGVEPGVERTELYAKPLELPDGQGVVTRIDLSVYPDDNSARITTSRPRDESGSQFSKTYELPPDSDVSKSDTENNERVFRILAAITDMTGFEKPSE